MCTPVVLLERLPAMCDYKSDIKEEIIISDTIDASEKESNIYHRKSVYENMKKKSTRYRKRFNLELEEISTDEILPITARCSNIMTSPIVVLERLPIKMEQSLVNEESLISDESNCLENENMNLNIMNQNINTHLHLDNLRNRSETIDTQQKHNILDLNNFSESDEIETFKFETVENLSDTIDCSDDQFQEDELSLNNKMKIYKATASTDDSDNETKDVLNNTLLIKEENEIEKSDKENSFYNLFSNNSSNYVENRNSDDLSVSNATLTNTLTKISTVREIIYENDRVDKNSHNATEKNSCKSISLLEACEQIAAHESSDLFLFEQNLEHYDLRDSNESDNELSVGLNNFWNLEKHSNLQRCNLEMGSNIETNLEAPRISDEHEVKGSNASKKDLFSVQQKNLFCELCIHCKIILSRRDKVLKKCYICQADVYFQCFICKSQYKYMSGIRKHVLSKHLTSDESFSCLRCNQRFTDRFCLKDHLRYCKIFPYLQCEFCTFKTTRSSTLKSHLLTRHRNYSPIQLEHILKKIIESSRDLKDEAHRYADETYGGIPSRGQRYFSITNFIKLYCERCNKVFEKLFGKNQRNCSICNTKLQMQCFKCERRYQYRNSMSMHLKTSCARMFNVVIMKCDNCNYLTCSKANLMRHVLRKHTETNLKDFSRCNKCFKHFKIMENMKLHQAACKRQPYFSCKYCEYKTVYKLGIKHHICQAKRNMFENDDRRVDGETSFKNSLDSIKLFCENCHYEEIANNKVTHCKMCETSFVFRCNICKEVKINFEQLRLHLIYEHSGTTYYDCPKGCGKSFSDESNYREHILMCNTESQLLNNYKPNEEVSKTLMLKSSTLEQSTPVFCEECGKTFKTKRRLKCHMSRCEFAKPPLNCEHCSFRTIQKNNLINHIQSKHASRLFRNIDAFQCKNCSVMFKNYFVYSRHTEDCRPRERKI